ncbi:MAG: type I restriction enzyme S subunit [Paraglaciecola sp.]
MSWPLLKLGELVTIKGGGTPSKNIDEYWNGDIPWASVKDFKGNIISRTVDSITDLGVKKSATNIIPAGTIITATRMALGKFAINSVDMAINQDLKALFINDTSKIERDYLIRFLESQAQYIDSEGKGATVKGVTLDFLKSIHIPLPPLNEQKRIAAILDKADAIRRKRQQAIQLADDFLRSVFLDMFGDPVSNPKEFRKVQITQLADVITGYAFKSAEYIPDSESSVRLCRGANTLAGYFEWKDTAYWNNDKLQGIENYRINPGDVILAMDRPWISSGLKVCVFPENQRDTYLVQRVARIRPKQSIYTDYLYSCILSNAFEKHCCPTETTVPHISPVELKNFEVLLPKESLINKYHDVVSKVRKSLFNMESALKKSTDAFNSLSQKAFAGQL